jgi:hypothetical protein
MEVKGIGSAARGDLNDTAVVDIVVAFRREVRNKPPGGPM